MQHIEIYVNLFYLFKLEDTNLIFKSSTQANFFKLVNAVLASAVWELQRRIHISTFMWKLLFGVIISISGMVNRNLGILGTMKKCPFRGKKSELFIVFRCLQTAAAGAFGFFVSLYFLVNNIFSSNWIFARNQECSRPITNGDRPYRNNV